LVDINKYVYLDARSAKYLKKSAELFTGRVEQFALRSINLLILFEARSSCLRSARSQLSFLLIRRAIKQTVVNIE